MGTKITIVIGDQECTAELLNEQAPHTCAAIERALPLKGVLSHAKLVDREVFFPVPFFIDEPENMKVSEKGDLAFWNSRQTFWGDSYVWPDHGQPGGPSAGGGQGVGKGGDDHYDL
jgi:hypothetical protein